MEEFVVETEEDLIRNMREYVIKTVGQSEFANSVYYEHTPDMSKEFSILIGNKFYVYGFPQLVEDIKACGYSELDSVTACFRMLNNFVHRDQQSRLQFFVACAFNSCYEFYDFFNGEMNIEQFLVAYRIAFLFFGSPEIDMNIMLKLSKINKKIKLNKSYELSYLIDLCKKNELPSQFVYVFIAGGIYE